MVNLLHYLFIKNLKNNLFILVMYLVIGVIAIFQANSYFVLINQIDKVKSEELLNSLSYLNTSYTDGDKFIGKKQLIKYFDFLETNHIKYYLFNTFSADAVTIDSEYYKEYSKLGNFKIENDIITECSKDIYFGRNTYTNCNYDNASFQSAIHVMDKNELINSIILNNGLIENIENLDISGTSNIYIVTNNVLYQFEDEQKEVALINKFLVNHGYSNKVTNQNDINDNIESINMFLGDINYNINAIIIPVILLVLAIAIIQFSTFYKYIKDLAIFYLLGASKFKIFAAIMIFQMIIGTIALIIASQLAEYFKLVINPVTNAANLSLLAILVLLGVYFIICVIITLLGLVFTNLKILIRGVS